MLSENINNINHKNLRIKFEKTGTAKYISHLDLNRLFSRAIIRAGIKVAHSEGFNPHPKIVFSSGLALGIESFCELVDIKIIETIETEVKPVTDGIIFNRLKDVFPPGINIKEVYTSDNAFKNIDKTRFYIFVKFVKPDGFGIGELDKLFEGDVFVEKKPGVSINLKDYIYHMNISEEFEYIKIDAVVKTNQDMFLNPENIIKGINTRFTIEDYFIQKREMYDKNYKIFR